MSVFTSKIRSNHHEMQNGAFIASHRLKTRKAIIGFVALYLVHVRTFSTSLSPRLAEKLTDAASVICSSPESPRTISIDTFRDVASGGGSTIGERSDCSSCLLTRFSDCRDSDGSSRVIVESWLLWSISTSGQLTTDDVKFSEHAGRTSPVLSSSDVHAKGSDSTDNTLPAFSCSDALARLSAVDGNNIANDFWLWIVRIEVDNGRRPRQLIGRLQV